MAIAALIYISMSVLLVVSAGVFFAKAIQSLLKKGQPKQHKNSNQALYLRQKSHDFLTNPSRREEIVAMLERQFASSPSSDS